MSKASNTRVESVRRDAARPYWYEPGAVRWLYSEHKPASAHRASQGWTATPIEMDHHPITFERLKQAQTWIRETFIGVTA